MSQLDTNHTTHHACKEQLEKFGDKTVGCCCTGHECTSGNQSSNDPLDNDKDLRNEIADIIESTGVEHTNEFWHRDSSLSYADKIIEATEAHTQSKLKAFAGEVEKAISVKGIVQEDEDLEDEFTGKQLKHELQENNINFGKNDAIDSFCESLKDIKEKYNV